MSYVCRKVNTKTDGDDKGVAGDDIDGETHEVHEASHLHQSSKHAENDKGSSTKTSKEHKNCEIHCYQRSSYILVQFPLNNLICHPVGVSTIKDNINMVLFNGW